MKQMRKPIGTLITIAALVFSIVSSGEAIHVKFEIFRKSGSRVEAPQIFEFWSQDDMIRLDYPPNPFGTSHMTLVANEHQSWWINQYNRRAVLRNAPGKRYDAVLLFSEHGLGTYHLGNGEVGGKLEIGKEVEFLQSRNIYPEGTGVVDGILCDEFRYQEDEREFIFRIRRDGPGVPMEIEATNGGVTLGRIRFHEYEVLTDLESSIFETQDIEIVMRDPVTTLISFDQLVASAKVEYFTEVGIDPEFGDYNFDGNRDFRVFHMSNGRCPVHYYFLYRPTTQSFELEKSMLELCNPRFDLESRSIYTFHPGGHSSHIYTSNKYVWDDNKLVLEYQVKQTHINNVGYRRVITRFEVVSDEIRPNFPAGYNWNALPREDP